MSNPWFRLHHEFANDPKVQMLSEADQRRLIMLMCLRCKDETLHDRYISFQLRVTETEWKETKAEFIRLRLIDKDNNLLNWDKRQYISDSSTERVRKHREKKKQVRNVTVTPPDSDTDTDTDTEQNKKESYSLEFLQFWDSWKIHKTGKGSKSEAFAEYKKSTKEIDHGDIIKCSEQYCRFCAETDCNTKHMFRWLKKRGWEDDYTIPARAPANSGNATDNALRDRINATSGYIDELQGNT